MRSTASRKICGISCISKNPYFEVIKLVYPHVADISNGMCEEEKNNMRALRNDQLGSCKKVVVTSDGVRHTSGHFSKKGSFNIKNYLTGGLLWFGHKYMRGKEPQNLWKESLQRNVISRQQMKAAKWKLSGKMVTQEQPRQLVSIITMEKFYGVEDTWVGSIEAAKKKEFSTDFKRKYEAQFPSVRTLNCKCDPPQDFQHNGDNTSTCAMTRHAKRDI